jgi:hypothetical protein
MRMGRHQAQAIHTFGCLAHERHRYHHPANGGAEESERAGRDPSSAPTQVSILDRPTVAWTTGAGSDSATPPQSPAVQPVAGN